MFHVGCSDGFRGGGGSPCSASHCRVLDLISSRRGQAADSSPNHHAANRPSNLRNAIHALTDSFHQIPNTKSDVLGRKSIKDTSDGIHMYATQ